MSLMACCLSSTVLESSGDGFVDAQANLALFSTQLRQYDLEMERGWIDLTPVSIRPRDPTEQAVVVQDGAGASRFQLPLREWDYRLFRMRRIDRFPLRAEFESSGRSIAHESRKSQRQRSGQLLAASCPGSASI